jgi:hypothetical protein
MTAWQRSNITERTEKGIGAVSFKRLLAAAGAGGIVAMIGGRVIGFLPACAGGAAVLVVVLVITHPVEGLPLFAAALRTLRGLAAMGRSSLLARLMQVEEGAGKLDGDVVFDTAAEPEETDDDLDEEWEYLGSFGDVGREGLSAEANPFRREVPGG